MKPKPCLLMLAGGLLCLIVAQGWAFGRMAHFDPAGLGLAPAVADAFRQAEVYNRSREWAGLWKWLAGFPAVGLVLLSGGGLAVEYRFGASPWRWPMRVVFLVGYLVWMRAVGFPFAWWAFHQNQAYGLTPLTTAEWLRLNALSSVVPISLFLARQILVYCCMPIWGRRWWWGTPLVLFVLFLVVPEIVSRTRPLDPVETLTPLDDPVLRLALDEVSDRVGMDLDYYVVDQSKRSRRMNMYVTGRLGREYVVLTDTLAVGLEPREAAAVMAHEILHQQRRTATMLNAKAFALVSALLVFGMVHVREGGGAIVAHRRLQVLIWLILAGTAVGVVTRPIGCWMNRREERAADAYALEVTRDPDALEAALLKVAQANLTPYGVPGWAYVLGASHPTTRERLALVRAWDETAVPSPGP